MQKRFTPEQIIKIIQEAQGGLSVKALCAVNTPLQRPLTIAGRFKGLILSEARKLQTLEQENKQLKRLIAEQALDIVAVVTKKTNA